MSRLAQSTAPASGKGYGYLELLLVLTIVVGLLLFFGRAHSHSHDAHPEEHIRKVLDEQVLAWNRGDLEGFMHGYWKSESLTFCSGGNIANGWQATHDRYRKRYQLDGNEMGQLKFEDVHVEMIANECALVRGRWKLQLAKSQPEGLYTLQMKRFPDGWKIVYDHTSVAESSK